jgi:hypothetical protein
MAIARMVLYAKHVFNLIYAQILSLMKIYLHVMLCFIDMSLSSY